MHLVEADGQKVLLDCGLVRGARTEPRVPGRHFPFAPHELAAVVLSHAHIDHCGNLPNLIRQGFSGPIYTTSATRDLIALMLSDSARHHEEEAFVQRIIGGGDEPEPPTVTSRRDVDRTLAHCVPLGYDEPQSIGSNLELTLVNAGHILGSAMVALRTVEAGRDVRLTFTGDLGRRTSPLLRPPDAVPPADLVLCESTYGGRVLEPLANAATALEVVVRRTVERGGKVLIPAFSLGRTQIVVHAVQEAVHAGRLPPVPIIVDSPLAAGIAQVYRAHPECLNEDHVPRDEPPVRYVRSADESAEVSTQREPCVLVAPSGMCDGGRIVRHLKNHIDDPRCSVVLVSYQAPHTLGRKLLVPRARIRIHGRDCNFWADVVELPGFSGHPDHTELLEFLRPLAGRPMKLRLVHGEPEPAGALALALRDHGFADVALPGRGETISWL
jgi:metallo-beta-lactamase family protein